MENSTDRTSGSVSTYRGAAEEWERDATEAVAEGIDDFGAVVNPPMPQPPRERGGARLQRWFYQDGQLNRRAVMVAIAGGALIAMVLAQRHAPQMTGRLSDASKSKQLMGVRDARARPSVSRPLSSGTDSAMQPPATSNTNSFGGSQQSVISAQAMLPAPQPVFQPSVVSTAEPREIQDAARPAKPQREVAVQVAQVGTEPPFSARLKASRRATAVVTQAMNETPIADAADLASASGGAVSRLRASGEPDALKLRRGTRIRMRLLEAIETGAAAPARATVVADVVDATGTVIIAKGTEAEVPFSGGEYNGRVVGARNEPVLFLVKNQPEEINAEGTIKGLDGRAGIPGKVTTKGGPSVVGRVVGGAARAASRVVTGPLASIGGDVPAEMAGVYAGGQGTSTRRTVEVPKGTEFIFVVGL